MADPKFLKFDTLALHAGQRPDPVTGARAPCKAASTLALSRTPEACAWRWVRRKACRRC